MIFFVVLESSMKLGDENEHEQEHEYEHEEAAMEETRDAESRCFEQLAEVDGNRTHLELD